jgi:3D (Asp-Asp-Asp) domain-containing protein
MNRQMVARFGKLLLIAVFCWCVPFSGAQEQEAAKRPEEQLKKPVNAYRLDFSVNEMEDGKKINSRQYSMYLKANDYSEIKIGTRVPVEAAAGKDVFQYVDVGTSIRGKVEERENGLLLDISCDTSRFADPERAKTSSIPLLRQVRISGSTVASVGQPIVIGSADDPDSKRQYQLEVTATRLK